MQQPENILISGGWGYGNLGDDAILNATIKLTRAKYPNAKLNVCTYSIPQEKIIYNNCEFHFSTHRLLFGESAFKFLHTYKKSPFPPYLFERIANRLKHYLPKSDIKPNYPALNSIEPLFKAADMFIMSGGGYFNYWRESFLSRCSELQLAHRYQVPSFIIGQTLDDFLPNYKEKVKPLLKQCRAISVRDEDSKRILGNMDITSSVAPDLVLGGIDFEPLIHPGNEIVFIPAELPLSNADNILQSVADFAMGNELIVNIAITRLYNADIRCARRTFHKLRNHGVNVKLKIPNTFSDIAKQIIGAKFVVSRNLHGLILGYIGGAKVLSLHHGWKFKGFLQQINTPQLYIDAGSANKSDILNKLYSTYNSSLHIEVRKQLRRTVTENFNTLISL